MYNCYQVGGTILSWNAIPCFESWKRVIQLRSLKTREAWTMMDRPKTGEHNTSQKTLWWPPSRNKDLESSLCQRYPAIFWWFAPNYYSRNSSPMNNPPSLFSPPTFSHQVALFPFLCFCPCHFGRSSQAVPFVPPGLPGLGHLDHHLGHKLNVFEGSSGIAMICTGNYPYQMRFWWRWTNQEVKKNGSDLQHASTLYLSYKIVSGFFLYWSRLDRFWRYPSWKHKHPRCHSISWSSFMDILAESVHVNSVTVALSHGWKADVPKGKLRWELPMGLCTSPVMNGPHGEALPSFRKSGLSRPSRLSCSRHVPSEPQCSRPQRDDCGRSELFGPDKGHNFWNPMGMLHSWCSGDTDLLVQRSDATISLQLHRNGKRV